MSSGYACSTLFFMHNEYNFGQIAEEYEAGAEPANGYLTRLNSECVLVDATATETADWARQTDLAANISAKGLIAMSIFMVGESWALSLARDGQQLVTAAFVPDDEKQLDQLPHQLLLLERYLKDLFPDVVDEQAMDGLFGAMLEGVTPAEDGISELLDMLGCCPDWLRWSWYETIPEQLFLDPDLADRVTPLGEAKNFWEE